MSTPINLNKARKARARAENKARADANAVTFGLTKADKRSAQVENAREARKLDGQALEMPRKGADDGSEKP
ncbi:DUF4169 family protein [uncultured Tateyamaria sp.]|uniref:DUF4169 family protein n=1 Tax=Tateyamaria sp. 1078 TaxID=3417464 RepID=UPI002604B436|nr:DUF4169 family protein [uncultured Tateyamaria sp.]